MRCLSIRLIWYVSNSFDKTLAIASVSLQALNDTVWMTSSRSHIKCKYFKIFICIISDKSIHNVEV